MAKSRNLMVRIPIYSLSSGVGRQAFTKRLPTEAENIDNCFVTLEKSVSKRSGFEFFSPIDDGNDVLFETVDTKNLWFYWFDISDTIRYLVIVHYKDNTDDLIRIFKITDQGWLNITSSIGPISDNIRDYLTYKPDTNDDAKDVLKAVSIGQNILILNRKVKAGFSSEATGKAVAPGRSLENSFQIVNGGTQFQEGTVYRTSSAEGAGLEVTVNEQGGTIVSIATVENSGDGYNLNETITILNPFGTNATVRLVDILNTKFNLDGTSNTTEDLKGRKIDYYTTIPQDPEGKAKEYNEYANYLSGDEVIFSEDGSTALRKVYKTIQPIDPEPPEYQITDGEADTDVNFGGDGDQPPFLGGVLNSDYWEFERDTKLLLAEDFFYPDPEKPELGQAVPNFGDIKFPPLDTDMIANNGFSTLINDRTEKTLTALYPKVGDPEGRGKIYFCTSAFGAATPGYYRIISKNPESGGKGRPYTQKVRTPTEHSVFDADRMPVKLSLENQNNFSLDTVNWFQRTAGTNQNNSGPTVFKDVEGKNLRQVEINAMSFYRGRLFMAASDTLFSSRVGQFNDLWVQDPAIISEADPLDLQASSNRYSKIMSMVPYVNSLFINTESDTQFELLGSENQITPLTAELSPTAFYATSPVVDPVLMGTQIYFAAPQKFYIYFSRETASLNNAVEVSQHIPNYLPNKIGTITVANSKNTLFLPDDEIKNYLYVYTNRFSADQVVQNAFHRWVLREDMEILSSSFYDNFLFVCLAHVQEDGSKNIYIQKIFLDDEPVNMPRIDNRSLLVVTNDNTRYIPETNETEYTINTKFDKFDTVILHTGWGDYNYSNVNISSQTVENGMLKVRIPGRYDTLTAIVYFGTKFTMNVELSELFYRDQNNNVIDGVLNLRSLNLRHFQTGDYKILVTRKNRSPVESVFNNNFIGETDSIFPSNLVDDSGEFNCKILGYSNDIKIQIQSEFSTPVNITQIEIKGKFKAKYSSLDK